MYYRRTFTSMHTLRSRFAAPAAGIELVELVFGISQSHHEPTYNEMRASMYYIIVSRTRAATRNYREFRGSQSRPNMSHYQRQNLTIYV